MQKMTDRLQSLKRTREALQESCFLCFVISGFSIFSLRPESLAHKMCHFASVVEVDSLGINLCHRILAVGLLNFLMPCYNTKLTKMSVATYLSVNNVKPRNCY